MNDETNAIIANAAIDYIDKRRRRITMKRERAKNPCRERMICWRSDLHADDYCDLCKANAVINKAYLATAHQCGEALRRLEHLVRKAER